MTTGSTARAGPLSSRLRLVPQQQVADRVTWRRIRGTGRSRERSPDASSSRSQNLTQGARVAFQLQRSRKAGRPGPHRQCRHHRRRLQHEIRMDRSGDLGDKPPRALRLNPRCGQRLPPSSVRPTALITGLARDRGALGVELSQWHPPCSGSVGRLAIHASRPAGRMRRATHATNA
jgi:hypothetical protein